MVKTEEILRGLEIAYQKLIDFKIYKKSPMIVYKDGEIVEIPWQELEAQRKEQEAKK